MPQKESEFFEELRETFAQEAREQLQTMASGLLDLEKADPGALDDQMLEEVYRAAHSMKGAARAVNEHEVEAMAHAMEDVFSAVRKGRLHLGAEDHDELQRGLSSLETMLTAPDEVDPAAARDLRQRLYDLAEGKRPEPKPEPKQKPEPKARPKAKSKTKAKPEPKPEPEPEPEPQPEPDPEPVPQAQAPADGSAPEPAKAPNLSKPDSPKPSPAKPEPSKQDSSKPEPTRPSPRGRPEETVRVEVSKLDAFLLKAESMLSVKLTLEQRLAEVRELAEGVALARKQLSDAKGASPSRILACHGKDTALDALDDTEAGLIALASRMRADLLVHDGSIKDLLDRAKRALMFPFASVALPFPKMVRDLARERGKEAELVIVGGQTQIDKRILEGLKAPLTHMLRNAVDHGLESPEQRTAKGKEAQGRIRIIVSEAEGDKVEVAVDDDGGGFNLDKLRRSAPKALGLSKEEAEQLPESELLELAFRSGMSSSTMVTDLSGRGLGLAIVREDVERLGGRVTLETEAGKGTTMRLLLPLTLATFRGILVRVADRVFVAPTAGVSRVLLVHPEDIHSAEGREIISLNGKPCSLNHLMGMLALEPPADTTEKAAEKAPGRGGPLHALLLASGERRLAVVVDEVLGEQDVLVKGLGKHLSGLRNISGATVLGSGAVVPVLNTMDLLESATRTAPLARAAGAEEEAGQHTVLVVEDSVTSRTLIKNILQSAGYQVRTAVDGVDGLTVLRSEPVDLAVLDIDMPRMNGFELTDAIRKDRQMAELPVILLTARSSREDRERGIELGANAYLVKSSFDQSNLLDVIQRFL